MILYQGLLRSSASWARVGRGYLKALLGLGASVGAVALGGVVLVVVGGASVEGVGLNLRGDLFAVVAMLLFSAYFVMAKEVRPRIDTFTLQTTIMGIGALVLLPMAAIDAGRVLPPLPSWSQWGWLVLLMIIPGTGHFLMNWAHLHVTLSLTGILMLAIPVLSTLGAWLVLDQALGFVQGLGMVVVLASLVLVVRRDARLQEVQTT